MHSHPAAVVVGGQLNGLSVCRSLAKGDVPVYVLDHRRLDAAMWSRYAHPVRTKPLHGPNLLHVLRSLSKQLGGRPVLVITDEMALLTISEFRAELAGLFRLHLPAHETVLMLHDKARFHEFAVAHGLPVPRSEVLRDPTDIQRIQALRLPVIIKPADKRFFHLNGAPRLIIANDYKTADGNSRKLLTAVGEIIVQECIEGPDDNIYFCLFYRKDNVTKAIFTGRKLASHPPGTGSTALCVEVTPGDLRTQLEDLTETFLVLSNYAGFGGIEYKWDAYTERFLLIEPTVGRTDWQEEIATLSGANIPVIGYCQECDLPMPPDKPTIGVVWQGSYIERILDGLFGIIPPSAIVVDGYWRRDDPIPALIHYPIQIIRLIWGAIRRLRYIAGCTG